jgi:hypothetical protein
MTDGSSSLCNDAIFTQHGSRKRRTKIVRHEPRRPFCSIVAICCC